MTKVGLFKHLTPQEIDWMLIKWKAKTVTENSIIIKEGTSGDEMFVIEAGRVEVYLTRGDVVLLLTELPESSFFGEMALIADRPRSASVKAKTNCRLLTLKKEDFRSIIAENPKVAAKFLLALSEDLCNRILGANTNLEKHFLVNQAIVDNESFRNLYILTHKAPSSSG